MTQEQVLKILRSGRNVFLTGQAGTGKTYVLKKYIEECNTVNKNVLCTAPTGIASLNLATDGIIGKTMHSAFGIPIPAYGKMYDDISLSGVLKEVKLADVIIVDEISMCRNDCFEYFANVIKKFKKELSREPQIIVCGDFFQLPPVVKKDEVTKLKQFGLDPSGYCFMSPEWKKMNFRFCELTEIKRQNDTEFINNLGKLRCGDTSCIKYFNQYVKAPEDNEDNVVICSLNSKAGEINEEHLARLPGPRYAYGCEKKGRTAKEYSVDETIFLKPGAKIIFTVNDVINQEYQNGTIGVVKKCLDKDIVVQINEKEVRVYPYEWKTYNITVSNGQINKKEIGSFKQLPIKLAYAVTMHKTQGQTYDKCVISPDSFADGQLYVALSRVKTIEGLTLTEPILPEYIKTNKLVAEFYKKHEIEIPDWIDKKKKEAVEKRKKKQKSKKAGTTKKSKTGTTKKSSTTKKAKIAGKIKSTKTTSANRKQTSKKTATSSKSIKKTSKTINKTIKKGNKNVNNTKNTGSSGKSGGKQRSN